MPLYSKRFSTVELEAEGLHNEEGEPISSIEVEKVTIRAGDRIITISVNRGGTKLGEFGKGSTVALEVQEKTGITTTRSLFKADL